jgi:hypothetical protein
MSRPLVKMHLEDGFAFNLLDVVRRRRGGWAGSLDLHLAEGIGEQLR